MEQHYAGFFRKSGDQLTVLALSLTADKLFMAYKVVLRR